MRKLGARGSLAQTYFASQWDSTPDIKLPGVLYTYSTIINHLTSLQLLIYWFRDPPERERLTTHDALSYLREVKNRFANNRKVYDR